MRSKEIIKSILAAFVVLLATVFTSPKGFTAVALWISLSASVLLIHHKSWKNFLLLWIATAVGGIIAQNDVMPIPFSLMASLMVIGSLAGLLPFALHRWLFPRFPAPVATLIFPVFYTLFNFMIDHGPQGTWSNLAYTQYHFTSFALSASLFGLYGILFMVSWFASLVAVLFEEPVRRKKMAVLAAFYLSIFLMLNAYGIIRKNLRPDATEEKAGLATVVINNNFVLETIYEDATGNKINVPPDLSFSDPILTEIQKGQSAFLKAPAAPQFRHTRAALDSILNLYFQKSATMRQEGARLILWPEGAIMAMKEDEQRYRQLAADFARENNITLCFSTAVFHTDKVDSGGPFIENKLLTFGPDGSLLNEYFKNVPIMGVEPSFPGDGIIPGISTQTGVISPAICYDLDFPELVSQVSRHHTDLLVVPTGDWKSISPYHTYMAAFRAIENGVSVLKAVTGGLSAYIDHNGKILAQSDYYDPHSPGIVYVNLPVTSIKTPFVLSFTIFFNVLVFGALSFLLIPATKGLLKLTRKVKPVPDKA